MGSLVLDLQRAANDEATGLATLARLAITAARKLGLADIDQWLKYELEGYPDSAELPEYRFVRGSLIVRTPYRDIPATSANEEHRRIENIEPIRQPIAQIQELAKASQQSMIQRGFEKHGPLYLVVTNASLHAILDRVRTIILEWSLDLESQGILGEGMTFTSEEKQNAQAVPHIVNVFQGDVGQANLQQSSSGTQQVTTISGPTPGEIAKLVRDHLDELRLEQGERDELEGTLAEIETEAGRQNPDKSQMRTSLERVHKLLASGSAASQLLEAVTNALGALL